MTVALVTGLSGFIGRRLAAHLLAADPDLQIVALARPPLDRARSVGREIDEQRIKVLPGDIAEPRLGLGEAEYDELRRSVQRVFHLAAVYDLAVPPAIAYRANVEGTRNVLALCADAGALERHAYVSTAYVAGRRTGTVREDELAKGQGFKNHYESTKFQAEVEVRESMESVPTTVLRPAIVVGDSRTGETQKFDGPYFLLRVIALARRWHLPLTYFGRSEAPFNVVPVDYVVAAIAAAASDPAAVGETLHLVDPDPLTARELTSALAIAYAGRAPRGRIAPGLAGVALRLPPARRLLGGTPHQSLAYLNHPVRFDTSRQSSVLGELAPPKFRDYVDAITGFFRAHEDDPGLVPRPARGTA
jgi:thioester reductase-like protein